MTRTIRVRDLTIYQNRPIATSVLGSVNSEYVEFDLDAEWDGLNVYACFRNGIYITILLDESRRCAVPWEMFSREGRIEVGVLGVLNGQVNKPTLWIPYSDVRQGVDTNGGISPSKPTPTLLEQIIEIQEDTKASAESAAAFAQQAIAAAEKAQNLVDDSVTQTDKTWSSRKILDSFAAALVTTDGPSPVLRIYPDEGSSMRPVSHIAAVQEGEGDPSPENVRPITGWENAKLWRGGVNLFDISRVSNNSLIVNNGDSITVTTTSGSNSSPTTETLGDICPGLMVGRTYTINADTTSTGRYIYILNSKHTWAFGKSRTITEEDLNSKILFYASGVSSTATISNIIINEGGTSVTYEPYNQDSQMFALPLGQTVYGGTLDWASGVLTVTHKAFQFTGSENWKLYPEENVYGTLFYTSDVSSAYGVQTSICSSFKNVESVWGSSYKDRFGLYSDSGTANTKYFRPPNASITTVAEFKEWLSQQNETGSPVTLVYKVYRPTTVQLTPTQISALAGLNTVYSDTGNTSATYNKSISRALSELQSAIIALGASV